MEPSGSGVWCVPGVVLDDRYLLVREIGRGGMGVVYEAKRVELGLRVALKFLRTERLDNPRDRSRFDHEVLCVATLRHENIVQLLDFGASERGPFAVFELVDGSSLADALDEDGVFELPRVIGIMLQIGRALSCAHSAGVIHRDLKSSNIMLTKHADGRDLVKVLDFGIARTHRPADSATPTDGPAGTVGYMAPEVARGESRGDALTDIYSMGVLFYELLSGLRPHHGDSPNALLHSVMTKPSVPLESHKPALPAAVLDLIRRTISRNRDHRPQTVAQFLDELSAIARDQEGARPCRESGYEPLPLQQISELKARKVTRTLAILLGGAVLGAALNAALTRMSSPKEQSAAPSPRRPSEAFTKAHELEITDERTPRNLVVDAPLSPLVASERDRVTGMTLTSAPKVGSTIMKVQPHVELEEERIDQTTGFDVRNPYE